MKSREFMQEALEQHLKELGGPGSGNWGHIGIPGYHGGSQAGSGGVHARPDNYKDKKPAGKKEPEKKEDKDTDKSVDKDIKDMTTKEINSMVDDLRKEEEDKYKSKDYKGSAEARKKIESIMKKVGYKL